MTAGKESKSRWRRVGEAAFFVALIALLWSVDTWTKFSQLRFHGAEPDAFRLIAEQVTSAVVVLALVPGVAWWLTRFPLRREHIASALAGLVIGSVLFAVLHYFLMVGLRIVIYPLAGKTYVFSDFWFRNLVIEFQKDLKIYLGLVAIIAGYRYYRDQKHRAAAGRLLATTG